MAKLVRPHAQMHALAHVEMIVLVTAEIRAQHLARLVRHVRLHVIVVALLAVRAHVRAVALQIV